MSRTEYQVIYGLPRALKMARNLHRGYRCFQVTDSIAMHAQAGKWVLMGHGAVEYISRTEARYLLRLMQLDRRRSYVR